MKIRILETSDLHGFVLPTNFTEREMNLPFSMAKAKSKIDELTAVAQEQGEIIVKIENGDLLQGSPLAYYLAKNQVAVLKTWSMSLILLVMMWDCLVIMSLIMGLII